MKRRDVLALTAFSTVGLSGCTGDSSTGEPTPEDTSTDDRTEEGQTEDQTNDGGSTEVELDELERDDVVELVRFDPVVNKAYVEVLSDPPVDEIVLESAVAEETTRVVPDDADAPSVPVDHEGDTLSIVAVVNDSEGVVAEEEWSPPTPDDFEEEIIDEDDRVVADVEIVDEDIGYTAQVNVVEDTEASEIHITSTVAQGEFSSDTLDGLDYGNVQINAVQDEVTVRAVIDGEEEVVHREHLQPS